MLGPGAANNSTRGGDLVTTVAFGIPSSVSTAILLGAFIIQGIVPGPALLDPAKHLSLTFSFVWILIVANIITVAICFLFLKQLAKITFVKGTLLIPFLLLLIFLGGFAVKNSLGDMIVVLIFGALGWFMVKLDWPRPPLLLGLILGGIAETNLFIATRIYGASWITHPGVLVIALIIAVAMLYPWYQEWRKARRSSELASPTQPEPAQLTEPVSLRSRVAHALFALFFVALLVFIVYQAKFGFGSWEPRAALFPLAIGAPSLILAIFTFLREFFCANRPVASADTPTPLLATEPELDPAATRKRTIAIVGWVGGFFLAILLLGFTIASAAATFLYFKFSSGEKWSTSIVLALAAWAFFYGMFDYALQMPFPQGALFEWVQIDVAVVQSLFAAVR